ncbi:PREDICTED: uncharacterized protein LOC106742127 [Dinoponera quadriceps]|uniref:Uncharacterized protein LOC106742127 n=1 Tax=Dinoponera quadriceps TaxID=609295 RepID=A0A6P3WW05_DINQU|nr:PREDICTED: uncharacterized protein LOC106742127 [Dinoponera quadriceps]
MRGILSFLVVTSGLVAVESFNNDPNVEIYDITMLRTIIHLKETLKHLHICSRREEVMELCVKRSIESIKPHLMTGVPDLNIPSFDPYVIKGYDLIVRQIIYNNVTMRIAHMEIYGLTDFVAYDIEISADMSHIKFKLFFPSMKFITVCDMNNLYKRRTKRFEYVRWMLKEIWSNITITGEYYEDYSKEKYFQVKAVIVRLTILGGKACAGDENNKDIYINMINDQLHSNWDELVAKLEIITQISASIKYLHRCSRDKQIKDLCMKRSIESIKFHLATGIPHLNIPSFEPYIVDSYQFSVKGIFNSLVNITHMKVYNLINYEIFNIQIPSHMSQIKFDAYFFNSPIYLSMICDVNATLFGTNISRTGYVMNWKFERTKATITINGEFYNKYNEEYFQVNNVLTTVRIAKAKTYMGHVDNNYDLTSFLHTYANAEWDQTKMDQIQLVLEVAVSNVIKTITNKIYSFYPMKILMPPS